MTTKKHKNKLTTIACSDSNARAIFVAGTFNDWDIEACPMKKGRNGKWSVKLDLSPGSYEYKFIADGEWTCNPGSNEKEEDLELLGNDKGTFNRILTVS